MKKKLTYARGLKFILSAFICILPHIPKISPNFRQILVLGGFCLWLEELPPFPLEPGFGSDLGGDEPNWR